MGTQAIQRKRSWLEFIVFLVLQATFFVGGFALATLLVWRHEPTVAGIAIGFFFYGWLSACGWLAVALLADGKRVRQKRNERAGALAMCEAELVMALYLLRHAGTDPQAWIGAALERVRQLQDEYKPSSARQSQYLATLDSGMRVYAD